MDFIYHEKILKLSTYDTFSQTRSWCSCKSPTFGLISRLQVKITVKKNQQKYSSIIKCLTTSMLAEASFEIIWQCFTLFFHSHMLTHATSKRHLWRSLCSVLLYNPDAADFGLMSWTTHGVMVSMSAFPARHLPAMVECGY